MPLLLKGHCRCLIYPECLELGTLYLPYQSIVGWVHRVELGSDVTLPIPFDILTFCDISSFMDISVEVFHHLLGTQ